MKNCCLSFSLAAIMMASMITPAFAAVNTHNVEIYYNESKTPVQRVRYDAGTAVTDLKIFDQGISRVSSVRLESGSHSQETEGASVDGTTGTLPNGTTFTLKMKEVNSISGLYLSTSNIVDDITIKINTDSSTCIISANSGDYGSDDNYGSINNPTCDMSTNGMEVVAGESMSLTFTPKKGKQISKLNIRTDYSNKVNLIDTSESSARIDGIDFSITKMSDGRVSVSSQHVIKDLFITALTIPEAVSYDLTVNTDSHIKADVSQGKIFSDKASNVTFSPVDDYSVDRFVITQGNIKETVHVSDSSVKIGDNVYTIAKKNNGDVILNIPKATENVIIDAYGTHGSYYVSVTKDKHISSNYDETVWVNEGESVTVVLTPDNGYNVNQISVSMGEHSVKFRSSETNFKLNGETYRVNKDKDGVVYLYLHDIDGDVKITPSVGDFDLKVMVKVDEGITSKKKGFNELEKGEDFKVVFEPKEEFSIKEIKVVCGKKTYTAEKFKSYITINGQHCPVSWEKNGKVTITLYDIDDDMTISAKSDYSEDCYKITKKPDKNSTIIHDGKHESLVEIGKPVTITVRPKTGYDLLAVKISTKKDNVTIYGDTNRFILNDRAYYVTRQIDGSWIVNFTSLPDSITIQSETKKQDSMSDPAMRNYHTAYMKGVGNGKFAPDRNMTRAEAVAMLSRVYFNENVNGFASTFIDVPQGAWYSPYIGWAQSKGLLSGSIYNGTFAPNRPITRAEFVDMLISFSGSRIDGYSGNNMSFRDLDSSWVQRNPDLAAKIAYTSSKGWVNGYPDGTFGPNQPITRGELVAMTNRATQRKPDVNYITANLYNLTKFVDVPNTHWAFYDVMEAANSHYGDLYQGIETWVSQNY